MFYINVFLNHLKLSYYAKGSIDNYFNELKKLKKYFKEKGIEEEKDITENDIKYFIEYLKEISVSDYSYMRALMFIKIYFNYLEKNNIIFISPMRDVEIPKEKKTHFKILTKEEVIEIFENVKTDSNGGIKARAILELLYSSALRPGEVTNIKLTDIDFKNRTILIRMGKNRKDRIVPVGEKAFYWIEKYINEVRPKYESDKSDNYLFLLHFQKGKKMNYPALKEFLKLILKRNNIKWFKPFSLRPSAATHMLQNGMGILYIKELLGHSEVETIKIYLRVNQMDLRNELNKKHPRFNKNHEGGIK